MCQSEMTLLLGSFLKSFVELTSRSSLYVIPNLYYYYYYYCIFLLSWFSWFQDVSAIFVVIRIMSAALPIFWTPAGLNWLDKSLLLDKNLYGSLSFLLCSSGPLFLWLQFLHGRLRISALSFICFPYFFLHSTPAWLSSPRSCILLVELLLGSIFLFLLECSK